MIGAALMRDFPRTLPVRIALLCIGAAAILLVVAAYRAFNPQPIPVADAPSASVKHDAVPMRALLIDPEEVTGRDIFSVDRMPAESRYPLPGEATDRGSGGATGESARPVVLGTAIGGDGSAFATVQIPGAEPRIVRVGDRVGVYTVVSIERGSVTFRAVGSLPFQVFAP